MTQLSIDITTASRLSWDCNLFKALVLGSLLHLLDIDRLRILARDALWLLFVADGGHPGWSLHPLAAQQPLCPTQSHLNDLWFRT